MTESFQKAIGPPTSPTNSNYLTSDRNDTKGYERFNSYLGHSLFCLITSLNSLSGGLHVKITKITSTCSQIDNSSSCSIKNKNNNCTFVCDVLFPLDTIFIAEKKKKMIFMTRTMLSFDKILPIKRPRVK